MKLNSDSSQHPERGDQLGLISDLARLGMRDDDLSDIASRIQATPAGRTTAPAGRPIKVYLAEEQPVLRTAYQTFLEAEDGIELLGSSEGPHAGPVFELGPDVMIVGVKALGEDTVGALNTLRQACPDLGLVVLFAFYEPSGVNALRGFLSDTSGGAYLLKHTVDTAAQLARIVRAVADGRFIMDPGVMAEVAGVDRGPNAVGVEQLSAGEQELLSLVAKTIVERP